MGISLPGQPLGTDAAVTNVVVCDPTAQHAQGSPLYNVLAADGSVTGVFVPPSPGVTTRLSQCQMQGGATAVSMKWTRGVNNSGGRDAQVSLSGLTGVVWFTGLPASSFSNTSVLAYGSQSIDFRVLRSCREVPLSDGVAVSWDLRDADVSMSIVVPGPLGW